MSSERIRIAAALGAGLLAAGAAGAARAQDPGGGALHCRGDAWRELAEDDGAIDEVEYAAIGDFWHIDWDLDRSGAIEKEEFEACYEALGLRAREELGAFDAWDADGDGTLTREEFLGPDTFSRFDADGSGLIEVDELLREPRRSSTGAPAKAADRP